MDAFVREHVWFLAFWGMIVLLGTIEFLLPQFPDVPDVRDDGRPISVSASSTA